MKNVINLENKVCIITGAGKGIGYQCALDFKEQGAKLALISRTKEDLEELSKVLNMPNEDLFWMQGDVSDESVVKEFVNSVISKFSHIDVLINNAGMRFRKSFLDISLEEWEKVMSVNAGSTFLFSREVGSHMVKRGRGSIINMASVIGTLGLPELAGYGASKGAIISLSKSLALEWAPYGVRVNVLAPGFCETSYTENFKKKEKLYQFTLDRTPMKKWGKSEDISNACLYLASDMSNYVTGEVISVDGGWSSW